MVDGINGQNNISQKYDVAGEKQGVKRKNDNPPDWFQKAVKNIKNLDNLVKLDKRLGAFLENYLRGEPVSGKFKLPAMSLDDKGPLDASGRLKEGWQYCPQTGEYRQKPQIDLMIGKEDNEWVDAGSSLGPKGRMVFVPGQSDYEPVFEVRDGRLVQVGKSKIQPKYL